MSVKEKKIGEDNENMVKYIDNFIAEQQEKDEKIKGMMSNTSYIEWLKQFTQDKDGFSDDDWLYFPEKISESDRKNVEILNLFYEGINKYADGNHMYFFTKSDFGNFYRVKLDDFGFEIGISVGQGTVFFFNKVEINDEDDFIDFNDIILGKKRDNADQANAILDSLSNMVVTAYESGVPIEAIVNTIDSTVNGIKFNNEDKHKTIIKK